MSEVIAPHDPHNLYIPGASPLDQDLQLASAFIRLKRFKLGQLRNPMGFVSH